MGHTAFYDGKGYIPNFSPARRQWLYVVCSLRGHDKVDESRPVEVFNYTSVSMESGEEVAHTARSQAVWVYCARCGDVLDSGLRFDGMVIPGRSSVTLG